MSGGKPADSIDLTPVAYGCGAAAPWRGSPVARRSGVGKEGRSLIALIAPIAIIAWESQLRVSRYQSRHQALPLLSKVGWGDRS